MTTKNLRILAAAAVLAMIVPGVATAETDGTGFATTPCELPVGAPMPGSETVWNADPSNAQAVVDAANEGDQVILANGTYDWLDVNTNGIRITGESRHGVVFDGGNTLEIGINVVSTDRVVVENLTVRNYRRHGIFFHHVTGYWTRYINAHNMGLYGIYAFDSRCGQIDNSFASGGADSGFYIGECFPCDATITDVIAESNALGYSGTNAGGNLVIKDSDWVRNAMGIVPNSLDGESNPPQRGVIIKENNIIDNNVTDAPGTGIAGTYFGVGIAIAGGTGNIITGNYIYNHALAGVVLSPLPDATVWIASGNTVWGNNVRHDEEQWPDAFDLGQGVSSGPGNCWAQNSFGNSSPAMIETIYDCGMPLTPPGGSPLVELGLIQGAAGLNGRNISDWRTWPIPAGAASQPDLNDPSADISEWLPEVAI